MTQPMAGQFSPDGQWQWTGTQWVPASASTPSDPDAPEGTQQHPGYAASAYQQAPGRTWQQSGYGQPAGENPHDTKALIFGLLTFFPGLIFGIPAFIFGKRGREYARQTGIGGGQSTFGYVVGIISFVLMGLIVLGIVAAVAIPVFLSQRTSATSMTSFEQAVASAYESDLASLGYPLEAVVDCPDGASYSSTDVFVCQASTPAVGGSSGEQAVIPIEVEVVDGQVRVSGASPDGGCGAELCVDGEPVTPS